MSFAHFRMFCPLCHLLCDLQVFFKMPASCTLLGSFIKMIKMVLCFLWQAPGNYIPAFELKTFSYRWSLLIIQSWAKFTQINFTFKINLYILPFLLCMFKILDYTDVNFFTFVFRTKRVINKLKKKKREERKRKGPPSNPGAGLWGRRRTFHARQYQCKKWNGHTGEG